jgi:hypothetical protein
MKLICGPPVETTQATRVFVSLLKIFLFRIFDYMEEILSFYLSAWLNRRTTAWLRAEWQRFDSWEFLLATRISRLKAGPNQAPIKWVQVIFHRPEHGHDKGVGLNATTVNLHGINGLVPWSIVCQIVKNLSLCLTNKALRHGDVCREWIYRSMFSWPRH